MADRPILSKNLSSIIFREYYYLKEELVTFCKTEGLSTSGSKIELTDRIAEYLNTGEKNITIKQSPRKSPVDIELITKDSKIEQELVC